MKFFTTLATTALLTASAWSGLIFDAINYGAADANEMAAFNAINDFRADPQNELFEMFQGQGFGGTKADFDTLLDAQATHTSNWWKTTFGSNLATNSMDFFETVPATLNAQFDALPAASSLSPLTWSDNIGWAAHQYATWVESDAGATSNPHAVAGAPGLGDRFTNAGVDWGNVGENIAADWPLDVPLMNMGFGIDWGPGVDGIQSPPGHRNSMLSTTFESIGIGIVDSGWTVGEYTQVQHFAREFSAADPIFYGYLFDASGTNGIVGSAVEVFDAMGNSLGSTTTDAQGAYTIGYTGGTPDYATYMVSGSLISSQGVASLGQSGSNYFVTAAIPEPSGMVLAAVVVLSVGFRRQRPNRRSC